MLGACQVEMVLAAVSMPVAEDVDAEPAAVDEGPEQAGAGEAFEACAGLSKAQAAAADGADGELPPDEGVDVDATGEDVAPGAGESRRASRAVSSSTTSAAMSVSL